MPETLLTPTGIKLFGRVESSLTLSKPVPGSNPSNPKANPTGFIGSNNFLAQQLNDANSTLARIYGFSYEGHYYDLPKPALFVVHGPGTPVDVGARDRTTVDTSGVVAKEWEFSSTPGTPGSGPAAAAVGTPDLMMWEYDKGDFSLRLDIESGPFEQILLAACLRGGPAYSSGSDLRMSGSDLRMSGSDLRMSGSDLRMSGSDLRRR